MNMTPKTNNNTQFTWHFLHPKYWGIWLGYGFLRLLSLIPYRLKFPVGQLIGKLLYRLASSRRKLAQQNIQLCFPQKSTAEVQQILQEHFESLGINLMESGINLWGTHRRNAENNESKYFTVIGQENLTFYPDQGLILVIPHFTTLEMTGLILSFLTSYRPIYRPHNNLLMEYLITSSRSIKNANRDVTPVSNKDTRALIRQLKDHKTLVILPDQKYSGPGSVSVKFFGYETPSNPGINRLAKLGKAKVLPVFTRRIGHHYELTILPALENFPSGDDVADTERLHHLYEAEIVQNPSQYLWVHDRWNLKNNNPFVPKEFLQ